MNAHHPLPEVTRFVVKLPFDRLREASPLKNQLKIEFPELTFRFEQNGDSSEQRIVVVPVMEDHNGRAHLCRAPQRNVIMQIYNRINDYLMESMLT